MDTELEPMIAPENPTPKSISSISDVLRVGLLVGLTHENQMHFEPIGAEITVVDLMGLAHYATQRINAMLDTVDKRGDVLTQATLQNVNALRQELNILMGTMNSGKLLK